MPDKRPSGLLCPERFRFPRLRLLPDSQERELLTLIDERPVDVPTTDLSRTPQNRGRRDDDRGGPRESRPALAIAAVRGGQRDVSGRAAGAHLTGQRQDGLICAPACEQYPGRLTGGRDVFAARRALNDNPPEAA